MELPILDSVDYLKSLNEVLPALETLSIILLEPDSYSIDSHETVRFKQVKKIAMSANSTERNNLSTNAMRRLIKSIQFNHLESLSVNAETVDMYRNDKRIDCQQSETAAHIDQFGIFDCTNVKICCIAS